MQRHVFKNRAWMKAAASSMMLAAVTMVGCSGGNLNRVSTASKPVDGGKFALAAEQALAKRDGVKAIAAAEAAVAAKPDNASYRTLLGRAYLLNGRYVSAEAAFADAMTLGSRDPRTVVSLALVQIAGGKASQARTMLSENRDALPAADYGLAVAMAGDAEEGVRVLTDALRQPDVNVKTRQNLAYAFALAGRWPEAKMMALQDLNDEQVRARITQWASVAAPGSEAQRVAMLTGVNPRGDDAGLPVRLALGSSAGAPVQMAAADPIPAPMVDADVETPQAPTAIASFAEPTVGAGADDSVRLIETAPVKAAAAPVAGGQTRFGERREVVQSIPAPAFASVAPVRAVRAVRSTPVAYAPAPAKGSYQVQLGAFDSVAVAKASYANIARRNGAVASHQPIHTRATVNGRQFYRLAVGGFDRNGAIELCGAIKAKGGVCFVRGSAAAPAERWAKAKPAAKARPQQFASR